jgi:hypothetical protein
LAASDFADDAAKSEGAACDGSAELPDPLHPPNARLAVQNKARIAMRTLNIPFYLRSQLRCRERSFLIHKVSVISVKE